MKNFIKLFILTLALLLTSNVSAQLLPISMGVKGGISVVNVSTKDFKSKVGYNAGLTLDLNLPSNIAIMTGLDLNAKGAKPKDNWGKISANYLQLPIHLGYKMHLAPGVTSHVSFGPYFAQGLWGKTEVTIDDMLLVDDSFGSAGALKRFDWGLGMGVGLTFLNKIQVRVAYDHGLQNVSKMYGMKIRNRSAYLTAGFIFF